MSGFPLPAKLLQRIAELPGVHRGIALCPDFAVENWRYKQLAEHLFDWLPDVALRPKERISLLYEPNKTLAWSCRRLFNTTDPSKRGEVGEILLHAACRQEFGTFPFIARLFYKMRSNDSVTSVDVAHVLFNEESKRLELWLGEAKLYDSVNSAKYKAYDSIKSLWSPDFLNEMKALIGPKIEEDSPYSKELTSLFQDETSIDQVISRIVIPICIAADFPETANSKVRDDVYISAVYKELLSIKEYMKERIPANLDFVIIFIPMDCKSKLEKAINEKVRSYL